MSLKNLGVLHKSDRQIVLTALVVIAIGLAFIVFTGREPVTEATLAADTTAIDSPHLALSSPQQYYRQSSSHTIELFSFDPNTADSTQFLCLGLQPWQVRNIYRYRAKGGIYRKKEDFARLYGLTAGQYKQLEPYIKIGADYQPASNLFVSNNEQKDTFPRQHKLSENETIDLSSADTTALKTVPGIGSYFARQIVNYRTRLGGYVSTDQLDEIEDFPTESKKYFTLTDSSIQRINVNKLSLSQLKRHPYIDYYQARAITDYRRLHGPLKSLDELRLLREFPDDVRHRLMPYIEY